MIEEDKVVAVTYDSMDELFEREEKMLASLMNYIARTGRYEYVGSEIIATDTNKYKLIFKLKAI